MESFNIEYAEYHNEYVGTCDNCDYTYTAYDPSEVFESMLNHQEECDN